MAINNNDVKLFESQRLTDEEDDGSRVTGREVIDGNVNNLFQNISLIAADCEKPVCPVQGGQQKHDVDAAV